jgi:hypothetical protein
MFNDTEAPACLALFNPKETENFVFYRNDVRLGMYYDMKQLMPQVSDSCRSITKIKVSGRVKIEALNKILNNFRKSTKDVFLTAFNGLRKDGMYRGGDLVLV